MRGRTTVLITLVCGLALAACGGKGTVSDASHASEVIEVDAAENDARPDLDAGRDVARADGCQQPTDPCSEAYCNDGLQCTTDEYHDGICDHGLLPGYCLFDNACHAAGEVNPDNPCKFCDTDQTHLAWSAAEDGLQCEDTDGNKGSCHGGTCVVSCAPDCAGKECGDDGYGGSCGECTEDELCCAGGCHPQECTVGNEFGECAGLNGCVQGDLVCDASKAKAEKCNGLDDNCNGLMDDGGKLWEFKTTGEIWAPAILLPGGNVAFGNQGFKVYIMGQDGSLVSETAASGSVLVGLAVNPATGTIFFGAVDGSVSAIKSGGGPLWSKSLDSPPGGGLVYQGGLVYVALYSGKILALNEGTGAVQWQASLPADVSSTPEAGANGTVYVGCHDHSLYAVQEGSILWNVQTGGEIWSSPTLGPNQIVYFGSNDGWARAVQLDGTVKWTTEAKGQIWGKPLVAGDGAVYMASTAKYVTKLDAATGTTLWATKTDGLSYSSPVEGPEGNIYVGTTAGQVFCLEPENGQILWTLGLEGRIQATPLVVGNMLFVGSQNQKFFGICLAGL